MILTDREIQIAIERGSISIEPRPGDVAFSSTSLDLTLDDQLTDFNIKDDGMERIVDPSHPKFGAETTLKEVAVNHTIDKDGFLLQPGKLTLGWTKEFVNLETTARLAARIEGKSSLARLGLAVHTTAPTIHAGFKGQIRLEMVNHGPLPIRLRPDMRICQLIFELTLGTPDLGYKGQFDSQMAR